MPEHSGAPSNPVKRRLFLNPEDDRWSSCNHYAAGERSRVEIESEWTWNPRERESTPAQRYCRMNGAPGTAKDITRQILALQFNTSPNV